MHTTKTPAPAPPSGSSAIPTSYNISFPVVVLLIYSDVRSYKTFAKHLSSSR